MAIPLPKIEGFQPIPNSVMVPFMELQSAALAYAFGLNYEFGKRKIKSMDNDTFNSLTSEQIANMSSSHTSVLLQEFIAGTQKVLPAQSAIFTAYVTIEKLKVQANVDLAKWIALNAIDIISDNKPSDTQGQPSSDRILDTETPITETPGKTYSDIASYNQDAQGNVTTTKVPQLSLAQQATLIKQYEANIIMLKKSKAAYENSLNALNKGTMKEQFNIGRTKTAYIKRIQQADQAIHQQQQYLANVKQRRNPY